MIMITVTVTFTVTLLARAWPLHRDRDRPCELGVVTGDRDRRVTAAVTSDCRGHAG